MNLSPSLMCADAGHLAEEIALLDAAGANSFHIDIMDGLYVPNFALSWAVVRRFREWTDLPLEAHLMVRNLDVHIEFARNCGIKLVYVHAEHPDAAKGIARIRELGMHAGLAINPDTEIEPLATFEAQINAVLMMRVRPGFAGQKAIAESDERLSEIVKRFPKSKIAIDGAVTPTVIKEMSAKGASTFILGTSSLFGKGLAYREIFKNLRNI